MEYDIAGEIREEVGIGGLDVFAEFVGRFKIVDGLLREIVAAAIVDAFGAVCHRGIHHMYITIERCADIDERLNGPFSFFEIICIFQ